MKIVKVVGVCQSSWSLRPWLLLQVFEIPFHEIWVKFDDFNLNSPFKQTLKQIHATAKVLLLQDGDIVVADSLAICEYLAERYPEKNLWPQDVQQRAHARSICAEMHAGFAALRSALPMNVDADLSKVGAKLWHENQQLRKDMARINQIWAQRPQLEGYVCGEHFSIADAFYAPVVSRLKTYGLAYMEDAVSKDNQIYVDKILALAALQSWTAAALNEHCFIEIDEPYRQK